MAHPWLCVGIISCECTDRSRKPSGARLRPGFSSVLTGRDLRGEIEKLGAVTAALGCRRRRFASSQPREMSATTDTVRD